MCLVPPLLVEPETTESIKYAKYFQVVLILHLLLIICYFLTTVQFTDGLVDLCVISFLFYHIKHNHYPVNLISSYVFYCGFNCMMSLLRMASYISIENAKHHSSTPILLPKLKWQQDIVYSLLYISPVIYFIIADISYLFYQSLRQIIGNTFSMLPSTYAPNSHNSYGSVVNTPLPQYTTNNNENKATFKAFTGQAYHLNK